jgi:hypothetical protein
MGTNRYEFRTDWRVEGSMEEVFDILSDAEGLTRWWPSVYLDVRRLEAGDADGVGSRYELFTKGWLPYTLRWSLRITDRERPRGFALAAEGDFVGRGVWSLSPAVGGGLVDVTYDWTVSAEKPLLRALSPVLRPIFALNHRWAMARGEESLVLELRRRRARGEAERAAIPPPPPATSPLPFALGCSAAILLLGVAVYLLAAH